MKFRARKVLVLLDFVIVLIEIDLVTLEKRSCSAALKVLKARSKSLVILQSL